MPLVGDSMSSGKNKDSSWLIKNLLSLERARLLLNQSSRKFLCIRFCHGNFLAHIYLALKPDMYFFVMLYANFHFTHPQSRGTVA